MNPHWLPNLVPWNQKNREPWNHYVSRLFVLFCKDFYEAHIDFQNNEVKYKHYPFTGQYPEAFIHLITCKQDDSGERLPDVLRSERIKWPKAIIDNYAFCKVCQYRSCTQPWVWQVNKRVKFYLPNQQYIVVLEQRNGYWLLITAYHLEHTHSIDKIRKEYNSQFSTVIQ